MRVQQVVMPLGEPRSWMLVDGGWSVVEPAEAFLAHLHAVERGREDRICAAGVGLVGHSGECRQVAVGRSS